MSTLVNIDESLRDHLIAPGILVVGDTYALPPRRKDTPRKPQKAPEPLVLPLRLPLYTHPRNVKP